MTLNASTYVQKHYFIPGWCKTSCCICTNTIIARIKNVYKKRHLIKKILILIWGFLLSILCDGTCVSDKLSCSTSSLRDVKAETHRCEVWFEFNDFSQIGQSRLGFPHCQKHCGSAVVSHVVLRIPVWQTSKEVVTSKKSVELGNHSAKIISEILFFSASYQQLRGNETRHRLAVRRRAASCPSPCDCPRSHPFHTSLLQDIWQTTQTHSLINEYISAYVIIVLHTAPRSAVGQRYRPMTAAACQRTESIWGNSVNFLTWSSEARLTVS